MKSVDKCIMNGMLMKLFWHCVTWKRLFYIQWFWLFSTIHNLLYQGTVPPQLLSYHKQMEHIVMVSQMDNITPLRVMEGSSQRNIQHSKLL